MTAYADLTEAKTAIGADIRCVLELTLTDTVGNRPSGDFWTATRTLHLCQGEPFVRDSTATDGFIYYEDLVKHWGTIQQAVEIHEFPGTISDTQIVLHNRRIAAQLDNSVYTFASGSPAMAPEPVGDEVQLAELLHFYNVLSATVVVKLLFFSGADTDQSTAANFESATIFNGIVQGIKIEGDEISLDITQDETALDSIPGRLLRDSVDKSLRDQRMPIVYGDLHTIYNNAGGALSDETNGVSIEGAIVAGLLKPTVAPCMAWKRDPDDDEVIQMVFNDCGGQNENWNSQSGWGGKTDSEDRAFMYDASNNLWTLIDEGPSADPSITWPSDSGTQITENRLYLRKHPRGRTYIPCIAVHSESSANIVTNPENMFDQDPFTFATLPLDGANWVKLIIKPVGPLGNILWKQDAIRAYVVIEGAAATGTPDPNIRYGIWRETGTNPWYIGQDEIDSGSPRSSWGDITSASSVFTTAFHDQKDDNSVEIRVADYVRTTGFIEPLMRWDWHYSYAETDIGELLVKIEVEDQGASGEALRIIAAGIIIENDPKQDRSFENRVVFPSGAPTRTWDTGYTTGSRSGLRNRQLRATSREITPNLWLLMDETTLDTDTTSGLTGTANARIQKPADIAANLILRWGDGVAEADVNFSSAAITSGANFGSAWWANSEIEGFAPEYTNAESQFFSSGEKTLREVVADVCSQFPMMVYRDVADDRWYTVAYPENATNQPNLYYSGSTRVAFHPNVSHPDAADYGKPYVVQDVEIDTTDVSQIFNRFRLRFHYFAPTGELTKQFIVTESPNDCDVYNMTTHLPGGHPRDLSATIGFDPSAVCATSQARYGVKRELTLDCPMIQAPWTAWGVMEYLIRRFTHRRNIVTASVGTEAYDLKLGHIVQYSDDLNLTHPLIEYGAAKFTGWKHA